MSKGVQIALGAMLIAVLLGWYATSSLDGEGAYRYFQTLAELREAGAVTGHVRVHGFVTPGSIERDVPSRSVRFVVQSQPPHKAALETAPLSVVYGSLEVSDMFKDAAEVVVEGKLDQSSGSPIFRATSVLAKCPSKFQAQVPAES